MTRDFFRSCIGTIRTHIGPVLQALATLAISAAALAFALLILEELYYDSRDLGLIEKLSDIHSFFASDAGKPVVGPILVILGAAAGWLSARDARRGLVFWISIAIFLLADGVLLWGLIQLSPPVNPTIGAVLEANGMQPDDNPMKGILSIAVAVLSGWLANRITKKTTAEAK